jgi:hypothetical protein
MALAGNSGGFYIHSDALTVGETLEINEEVDSEQNFVIFLDSESALKGISNTATLLGCLKTK